MAEYTKNLNLEKPDYEEYYDIGTFNANADKIDKGIEDSEKRSTQRLEVHKDSNDHTADKIRYSGKVGKDNVQDALDETDTRIDNIVSQGGSDNTEVVDARHSTTKDKTYSVLKDRLEDIERDTNVVETVTETSYDSVIPVPDSATKGQVSGVVRGLTATNLVENGDFRDGLEGWVTRGVSDDQYYFDSENSAFYINTKYNNLGVTNTVGVPIVGHKYYFKMMGKQVNGIGQIVSVGWGANSNNIYNSNRFEFTPSDYNTDTFSIMSKVFTVTEIGDNQSDEILISGYSGGECDLLFKDVMLVNLTQTFGAGNEPTKEECDQIFANYFDGTKSTIGSARVKSVGKNLLNINDLKYYGGGIGSVKIDGNKVTITRNDAGAHEGVWQKVNVVPNQPYILSFKIEQLSGAILNVFFSDTPIDLSSVPDYGLTAKYQTNYLSTTGYKTLQFTPAEKELWFATRLSTYNASATISEIQLEMGTQATAYESYQEDISYILAKQDDKIVNLRSLPNGTKDEIRLSEGKAIIRIGAKTDVASGTVINYTDMAENGTYYAWNEDGETETGIKGDTLGIDATTLTYQLAEPEIIPIRWTGLQAYENGTVYVDTVIPELGFYYDNGLEGHYPDQPIKEVDTLYRVDKETGYREPLDVSKCIISEDRLSFTHPDLVDGDLCDWDYVPMTESTRPETTLEFPTNLKASVNSLLDADKINKKEHNIFKARLDNHDRDIENVQIATVTAQSDIDTHKQDNNNPHNVTPEQIGAETPEGAQDKVDVVKDDLELHLADYATRVMWGTSYSATLKNGWSGSLTYVRNGIGLISITAVLSAGTVSSGTVIATLPDGYRPSQRTPLIVYNGIRGAAYPGLVIETNGDIVIRTPFNSETEEGHSIQFKFLFREV